MKEAFKFGKYIIEIKKRKNAPWELLKKRFDTAIDALDEREKIIIKKGIYDAVVRKHNPYAKIL